MAQLAARNLGYQVVVEPNFSSQLRGAEGERLNQQIHKVAQSIFGAETVKRLIQPLEQNYAAQHKQLLEYLELLRIEAKNTEEADFTVLVLDLAEKVWFSLRNHFWAQGLYLEVPDACPGSSNTFMYVWSKAEHYLECEIFGDGAIEFFYRNRSTDNNWGEDTTFGYGLSTTIFAKVALFTW